MLCDSDPLDTRIMKATVRKRRRREPLDVQLSVDVIFGDEPGERVTVIDKRQVPMVNDIFEARNIVVRQFVLLMLRAGVTQPKVVAEILPAIRLLPKLMHRKS